MRSFTRLIFALSACVLLAACESRAPAKRVGILSIASTLRPCVASVRDGLTERGRARQWELEFLERDASDDPEALPGLANELVQAGVDLIVAPTTPAAVAAKQAVAGTDIPVVFTLVSDPIRAGLVDSWRNDTGNVTGVVDSGHALAGKRLEHLLTFAPDVERVLVPLSESLPSESIWEALTVAAEKLGVELVPLRVQTAARLAEAYEEIEDGDVDAVYIISDVTVASAQQSLGRLVRRLGLPAIVGGRFLEGALVSFGDSWQDVCSQSTLLAAKVLSGVPPSDLPVERPRDPQLRLFASTARDIGYPLPDVAWSLASEILGP